MNAPAWVTVLLPTYNEGENVRGLLQAILDQKEAMGAQQLDSVVVDASSPDGTGEVVRAFAADHAEVRLLTRDGPRGLGNAYKDGMRFALEKTAPEVIVEMDADWSHDPRDLPRFIEALDGAD